eukprot:1298198-Pyramimonas_sp.AAC.1
MTLSWSSSWPAGLFGSNSSGPCLSSRSAGLFGSSSWEPCLSSYVCLQGELACASVYGNRRKSDDLAQIGVDLAPTGAA